jgi:hypothetical protein
MEAWGFQKNVYRFKDLLEYYSLADRKKKKGKDGKKASGVSGSHDKSKGKKRAQ